MYFKLSFLQCDCQIIICACLSNVKKKHGQAPAPMLSPKKLFSCRRRRCRARIKRRRRRLVRRSHRLIRRRRIVLLTRIFDRRFVVRDRHRYRPTLYRFRLLRFLRRINRLALYYARRFRLLGLVLHHRVFEFIPKTLIVRFQSLERQHRSHYADLRARCCCHRHVDSEGDGTYCQRSQK